MKRPVGGGCDSGAYEVAPPTAAPDPADAIFANSALLRGTVGPVGAAASFIFEYGPTASYGSQTPPQASEGGAVSAPVTGLARLTTFHYRLVVTNPDGKTTSADATFKTTAEPTPAPGSAGEIGSPVISALTVKPSKFAVAPAAGATKKAKVAHGTTFGYSVSEPAALSFAIERAAGGVKLRRGKATRCVTASKKNRTKARAQIVKRLGAGAKGPKGPKRIAGALRKAKCKLFVKRGAVTGSATAAGAGSMPFSGRIGNKALKPGKYRVGVTGTDAEGKRSTVRRASFTIVRG